MTLTRPLIGARPCTAPWMLGLLLVAAVGCNQLLGIDPATEDTAAGRDGPGPAADASADAVTDSRLDGGGDAAPADGAVVDGAVVDSAAVDGAAVDGAAVDGAAVDGAPPDGPGSDGPAQDAGGTVLGYGFAMNTAGGAVRRCTTSAAPICADIYIAPLTPVGAAQSSGYRAKLGPGALRPAR